VKITECLNELQASSEAILSAPEKGFVDLDKVAETLRTTGELLNELSPRLELGDKLIKDYQAKLRNKLETLKLAGASPIIVETENFLASDTFDFDQLQSLGRQVDQALARIFDKRTLQGSQNLQTKGNPLQKPEDYS
jgi:hypothetical protein